MGAEDEPLGGRRPVDGDVGLAVAVVVGRHRQVGARGAEGTHDGAVMGLEDEPLGSRRPVDGDVRDTVAVVIGRDRQVGARRPEGQGPGPGAGTLDEPLGGRRPVDGIVGLAVAIVVGRQGDVSGRTRAVESGRRGGPLDQILGRLRLEGGGVDPAIAVEVGRGRVVGQPRIEAPDRGVGGRGGLGLGLGLGFRRRRRRVDDRGRGVGRRDGGVGVEALAPADVVRADSHDGRGDGWHVARGGDVIGPRRQLQRVAARGPGLDLEGPLAVLPLGADRDAAEPLAGGVEGVLVEVSVEGAGQEGVAGPPAELLGDEDRANVEAILGTGRAGRGRVGRVGVGEQADPDLVEGGPALGVAGAGGRGHQVLQVAELRVPPVDQEAGVVVVDVVADRRSADVLRVGEDVLAGGPGRIAAGVVGLGVGGGGNGTAGQEAGGGVELVVASEHVGAVVARRLDQPGVEGQRGPRGIGREDLDESVQVPALGGIVKDRVGLGQRQQSLGLGRRVAAGLIDQLQHVLLVGRRLDAAGDGQEASRFEGEQFRPGASARSGPVPSESGEEGRHRVGAPQRRIGPLRGGVPAGSPAGRQGGPSAPRGFVPGCGQGSLRRQPGFRADGGRGPRMGACSSPSSRSPRPSDPTAPTGPGGSPLRPTWASCAGLDPERAGRRLVET